MQFLLFWVIFGSFWGPGGQEKSTEISTNANRTKLSLCELNSMGLNLERGSNLGRSRVGFSKHPDWKTDQCDSQELSPPKNVSRERC